jgi:hypothetical protein
VLTGKLISVLGLQDTAWAVIHTSLRVTAPLRFLLGLSKINNRVTRTHESTKKADMSRRDILRRDNNGGLETQGEVAIVGAHVNIF